MPTGAMNCAPTTLYFFHPLGYWWRIQKLIRLSAFLGKAHERRVPCVSARLLSEPGMHPAEIECSGSEQMLQMDFLQTPVARLP